MRYDDATRLVLALYRGVLRREPSAADLDYWIGALSKRMSPADVAEAFLSSDEFKTLVREPPQPSAFKLFAPPGHYLSPIVDPAEASEHIAAIERRPPPTGLPGIAIDRVHMIAIWERMLPFLRDVPFPETPQRGFHYAFENPSYSYGDGSTLHAFIRLYRPKRIIEIGSGWTSACALDTIDRHCEGQCELTFIDPYPHLLRELIADSISRVRIIESPVQNVSTETFAALDAGDILLIDSTHVLRTGSDVCFELFEIMPRLKSGVLVHFHDIFWPFEYPRSWAVDENRSWNELYAVRALLTDNPVWRVLFFNDYLLKLERGLIESSFPLFLKNGGGALWLEKQR